MKDKVINLAVTGASGAIYAQRLLHYLDESSEVAAINLIITPAGLTVIKEELDLKLSNLREHDAEMLLGRPSSKVRAFPAKDTGAAIASGSYRVDAMVIVPCSANSLGL